MICRRAFLQSSWIAGMAVVGGRPHWSHARTKRALPPYCALNGDPEEYTDLAFTTGDEVLDRQLVLELHSIAETLRVSPGFGIIEDGARPNAYATAASRVPNTRGTVCLGRTLLFLELNAHPRCGRGGR